jgi:protein TonB
METRFVLPLTVAATLHAFVFFGVKSEHPVPPSTTANPAPSAPDIDRILVNLDPPEKPDEDTEIHAKMPKGEPDAFTPQLPDESTPRPADFEQPIPPSRPSPTRILHEIPKSQPGILDGVEDTDWNRTGVEWSHNLDNSPRTRSQAAPVYPAAERNAGITGEVLVEFTVDESGRVLRPRVVRSTHTGFESSTLRAVEKWRFEPGKKNGKSVRFRMMVPVTFSLNS